LLSRQGWERHLEQSSRRHWIKRFYGEYGDVGLRQKSAARPA
jgi:hypothetical protein